MRPNRLNVNNVPVLETFDVFVYREGDGSLGWNVLLPLTRIDQWEHRTRLDR